jgi:hypothetical protein
VCGARHAKRRLRQSSGRHRPKPFKPFKLPRIPFAATPDNLTERRRHRFVTSLQKPAGGRATSVSPGAEYWTVVHGTSRMTSSDRPFTKGSLPMTHLNHHTTDQTDFQHSAEPRPIAAVMSEVLAHYAIEKDASLTPAYAQLQHATTVSGHHRLSAVA